MSFLGTFHGTQKILITDMNFIYCGTGHWVVKTNVTHASLFYKEMQILELLKKYYHSSMFLCHRQQGIPDQKVLPRD